MTSFVQNRSNTTTYYPPPIMELPGYPLHILRSSNGATWHGVPCLTDVSDSTTVRMIRSGAQSISTLEKEIWTTLLRGDMDIDGKIFNSVREAFKDNYDDLNAGYRHYNNKNHAYGTHARLLLLAALMTHGDILELGTGDQSTELLHDIVEDDNKRGDARLLVSAESDSHWLDTFTHLSSSFHQLLLVENCQL